MSTDIQEIAKEALSGGNVPRGQFHPIRIFPPHHEPEAKLDLGVRIGGFRQIRSTLQNPPNDKLQTSIVPDSFRLGGHAMINIIVEPLEGRIGRPTLLKHGKFMRIAGRVDELGNLTDLKIAIKSLSKHVEIIDGLPYRQEFEPTLPRGMTLEQAFDWFIQAYENEYGDTSFSHLKLNHMRPTSAYMSARTGYNFLRQHHKRGLTFVNEACEDLFVPVGADLVTPLCDFKQAECQFEWETVGALADEHTLRSMGETEAKRIGLQSMRNTLKHLIRQTHPHAENWEDFTVVDSKAEISRERTLANPAFWYPYPGRNNSSLKSYFHLLTTNTTPVWELLQSSEVKTALCRIARRMEKTRREYNAGINQPEIACTSSQILAA
jgi:hypothetical protein